MIENIGWTGSMLLALCALPQAYKSVKEGHSRGVSGLFLIMWLLGEILMQIYVGYVHGYDMPLLVNYWINTLFVVIILKYKMKERNSL